MTGRTGQLAVDGTLISASDVARRQAEEALRAEWERKAVRVVAGSAADAADCRALLAILGLDGEALSSMQVSVPHTARSRSGGRATAGHPGASRRRHAVA